MEKTLFEIIRDLAYEKQAVPGMTFTSLLPDEILENLPICGRGAGVCSPGPS